MNNCKYNFKRAALALACSSALMTTTALAGDLKGIVTNASQNVLLEGALVEIEALNIKRVTKRDGSFSINNLADGNYTVKVSYIGVPAKEFELKVDGQGAISKSFSLGDDSIEELLVVGQRASQASALNRQKNANRLTSVVSADAIGQFPDQNVAEALQRLPGMFIQRDQGEGRFVGIRGIDTNLNNLSINGVSIPSPESGIRSVAMDVIPSELVASLEVSKSVTPDMDADAIGGSIEVKSLSGLDRPENAFSITAQQSFSDLLDKNSPKLSGSYSTNIDLNNGKKFGVATALSWFERSFGSENIETDGGWGNYDIDDAASGDEVEVFGPEEMEQRAYWITRERLGLAVNFDYQMQNSNFYLRTLYSEFSDDEYRLRNEYKFSDGDLVSHAGSTAQFTDAEMDRDSKDRYEEQQITSLVLGGETELDFWTLEYSVGYAKSSEEEPNRLDVDFKGEGFDLGYAANSAIPSLTNSANAHDLSNFELDEIVFENNNSEDEETSFKIDATRAFVWNNNNGNFKFGAKLRNREKFTDADILVYDGGFNDAKGADFASNSIEWSLGNFGPGLDRGAIKTFFNSNRSNLELNALDTSIESQGASYNSDEDIFAAYAMFDLNIDKWNIVAGLRYENTDFSTRGNRVELIADEVADTEEVTVNAWNVDKSYSHLLPSLNIRYDYSDELVARFAYTNTIARPSFGDSAAFQIIETETTEDDGEIETERKAEVGNPELEAYEATNIDFSIEYYPGHIGVLSAGIFYKDISNFIVEQEVQDNGQWDGFEEVIQSVNGGDADITGLELAWTKTFDNGLLVIANGTFTDSDDTLPNQADRVGNLALGYETDSLSARVTWSHKSRSFQFKDQGTDVYQDAHNQIDLNVKYFINDNLNLYFNGVNLNDEPFYLYHIQSSNNYQYEAYGRTFELGVTWNAF